MKKIFAICIAALGLAACEMDFFSSDTMTPEQLAANPSSAVYTTDGIYTLFADNLEYKGSSEDGNYYVRHYFQLAELRGDNVSISGYSEDPFCFPYAYEDAPTEKNIYYTWWIAYKIINAANSNISAITPGASNYTDHLLGENYFLRAIAHFHMVTLFARPYVCGRDNLGVVLRNSMDYSTTTRATVGQVYDAIVEDLKKAQDFMSKGDFAGEKERVKGYGTETADKSYATWDAATALLARVYLYMEENDKCLTECNKLLDPAHISSSVTTGYDFADYPTHTYNHPETIWCVHLDTNHPWAQANGGASIASMYIHDNDESVGWGEHYWSDILIDNFQRYPNDKRFKAYFRMNDVLDDGKVCISVPYKTAEDNNYCSSYVVKDLTFKGDGSLDFKYNVESGKPTYTAVPTNVNGYTEYYVNGVDFVTGEKGASKRTRVFVRPNIGASGKRSGRDYIIYYNTKFSYQDGMSMLTSPVFLRWGEVVLNRAEANAKLGNDQDALDDVNLIRHRAGLTGAGEDMTLTNYNGRGYATVLDVVLDERRRELCFEGHRMFDVFRNRQTMDRRYVGYHEWGTIDYTDLRVALQIPTDEINASGIAPNPR